MDRVSEGLGILEGLYGQEEYFLHADRPIEVLVATMLSAQTTDAQVNKALPRLFGRYRSTEDYAAASIKELEGCISTIGLYKTKARNIIKACRLMMERFNGQVPDAMESLLELPGVGRKTANVVLTYAFGKVEGICIDTHCARLASRLGWARERDRVKIEYELMAKVPKEKWPAVTYLLISHGRAVCTARKPKCEACDLNKICPSAFRV